MSQKKRSSDRVLSLLCKYNLIEQVEKIESNLRIQLYVFYLLSALSFQVFEYKNSSILSLSVAILRLLFQYLEQGSRLLRHGSHHRHQMILKREEKKSEILPIKGLSNNDYRKMFATNKLRKLDRNECMLENIRLNQHVKRD